MSKKSRDKDSIIYEFNPDGPNVITDELSATSFMALREVHWNVEDDYHLDFRRYFVKPDGMEMPGKGTSIPNPTALINAMLSCGYGETKGCIDNIWDREDFMPSLGSKVAEYDDKEYKMFKTRLDNERKDAIANRGMNSEEFLEAL